MEAWKEELYHHGILGMKWGKKNGPPYPLGASDHSAAEKKAGWRKSLSGGSSAKQRYRERKRAIQDRYDKEEARIESPYKRGEYLSEKDMKRQKANEDRYDREWAKAKQQYKEEKKQYKEEKKQKAISDNEKRLNNPRSHEEAEAALKNKIKRDLELEQGSLKKAVSSLTGYNKDVSEYITDQIIGDMQMSDVKNMRSKMTKGQKFMDFMFSTSANQAVDNYHNKGYKELSKKYEEYKKNTGLKSGEKAYKKARREEVRRERYAQEARRNQEQRMSERDRSYNFIKDQVDYDRSRGIVNEKNLAELEKERQKRSHYVYW